MQGFYMGYYWRCNYMVIWLPAFIGLDRLLENSLRGLVCLPSLFWFIWQ